jgi:hypothetical protein
MKITLYSPPARCTGTGGTSRPCGRNQTFIYPNSPLIPSPLMGGVKMGVVCGQNTSRLTTQPPSPQPPPAVGRGSFRNVRRALPATSTCHIRSQAELGGHLGSQAGAWEPEEKGPVAQAFQPVRRTGKMPVPPKIQAVIQAFQRYKNSLWGEGRGSSGPPAQVARAPARGNPTAAVIPDK